MQTGIFLRYRDGNGIIIEPNIKNKVAELIPLLKENDNPVSFLRSHIKYAIESPRSVGDVSTWCAATFELYSQYEHYRESRINRDTNQAIIGLLELLTKGGDNSHFDWDSVRNYIIGNIGYFAPMSNGGCLSGDQEIVRDENGRYYYDDEMGRVEVYGIKTAPEEALAYYINETQWKYGKLHRILRYIALFDIAYEYTHRSNGFPDKISCVLFDNDDRTNYLDWQWQMPTPFDFTPVQWYPRSPYSNPEWLGSDLVLNLPPLNANVDNDVIAVNPTNRSLENWKEAFCGYRWQIEIPITQNVLIGDELEEYFNFFDRKLRWINGNAFMQSMLIVPANDDNGDDGIELARKFLSVMNLKRDVGLSERLISKNKPRFQPWLRPIRMGGFQGFNRDYILPPNYKDYSDKKWQALAFMREAAGSNSIYYAFLNYFKVVELANPANDTSKVKQWINDNVERVCNEKNLEWYQKMVIDGETTNPGFYLSKTERTAIAHAEYNYRETKNTHNPDDSTDWRRTREDIVVMRALARDILGKII
ncbi:methylamine utilization protein MauJ [Prevotella jejuni]|uniref:methylamine utilization protein MauJ n=1 Tax=Prevotella jejuni TaxID=1177574 RepID=UPI003211B94B